MKRYPVIQPFKLRRSGNHEGNELKPLYGDFGYLIDKYLGGPPRFKKAVAKADMEGRGFQSLD